MLKKFTTSEGLLRILDVTDEIARSIEAQRSTLRCVPIFTINFRKFDIVNKAVKISSVFPKHLFWDVKLEELDTELDQDLIIPRALYMTDEMSFEDDIEKLERIYSSTEIIHILKITKARISNRVCEMVANRYHIPVFHRYK